MLPLSYETLLVLRKGAVWVVRDEILHCVQNDKVGLGTPQVTVKSGWLILHCVQNDKRGASVLLAASY
jgi:predicted GH43/DUF377 family glycosyl hydrolase